MSMPKNPKKVSKTHGKINENQPPWKSQILQNSVTVVRKQGFAKINTNRKRYAKSS